MTFLCLQGSLYEFLPFVYIVDILDINIIEVDPVILRLEQVYQVSLALWLIDDLLKQSIEEAFQELIRRI